MDIGLLLNDIQDDIVNTNSACRAPDADVGADNSHVSIGNIGDAASPAPSSGTFFWHHRFLYHVWPPWSGD